MAAGVCSGRCQTVTLLDLLLHLFRCQGVATLTSVYKMDMFTGLSAVYMTGHQHTLGNMRSVKNPTRKVVCFQELSNGVALFNRAIENHTKCAIKFAVIRVSPHGCDIGGEFTFSMATQVG